MTLAAHVADVKVWVGGEMCNVSLLSPSQIVCDPPISQPFGLGVDGRLDSSVLPLVVVSIMIFCGEYYDLCGEYYDLCGEYYDLLW